MTTEWLPECCWPWLGKFADCRLKCFLNVSNILQQNYITEIIITINTGLYISLISLKIKSMTSPPPKCFSIDILLFKNIWNSFIDFMDVFLLCTASCNRIYGSGGLYLSSYAWAWVFLTPIPLSKLFLGISPHSSPPLHPRLAGPDCTITMRIAGSSERVKLGTAERGETRHSMQR